MPIPNPDYYDQALQALNLEDFDRAARLCLEAIDYFEKNNASENASVAYHLLGGVSYQAGDFEAAKSAYQRSLAHIEPPRPENYIDYARTCNNLAAAFNSTGDFKSAKEWLLRSIEIKKNAGDKPGLAASYHQLGIVSQTQENFNEAEQWYLKSLSIEEELADIGGAVATLRCLANIAEFRGDVDDVTKWYQKVKDILDKYGNPALAESLGDKARQDYDFQAAAVLYKKACDLSKGENKVSGLNSE